MRTLVVCHDAGGAELIAAWIKQNGVDDWSSVLDGPAQDIFNREFERIRQWDGDLGKVDLVLCGSSATSNWEILAWRMAKIWDVPNAVYLDHWKNYAARFAVAGGGPLALPDEVWVADRLAERLARKELPGANVVYRGNPYLVQMRERISDLDRVDHLRTDHEKEHVLVVYDRGEDVLWLDPDRWPPKVSLVRHRPHPADRASEGPLERDIAWADTVIGWDSMALAVALRAGRRVYSVLPPEERHIPMDGILYLPQARIETRG